MDYFLRAVENTVMFMPLAGAVVDLAMEHDPNEALGKFRGVVNAVADLIGEDGAPAGNYNARNRENPNIAFERAARQRRARMQRERTFNTRMTEARNSMTEGCARVEEVVDDKPRVSLKLPPNHPIDETVSSPPSDHIIPTKAIVGPEQTKESSIRPATDLPPSVKQTLPVASVVADAPVSSDKPDHKATGCALYGSESLVRPVTPASQSPQRLNIAPSSPWSPIPPVTDIIQQMQKSLPSLPNTPQRNSTPLIPATPLGPLDNPFLSQGEKVDLIDKIKEDEGLAYINEADRFRQRVEKSSPEPVVDLAEEGDFDFDSRASDSGYEECLDYEENNNAPAIVEQRQETPVEILMANNMWIRRPLAHKV